MSFKNARIVAVNADATEYHNQAVTDRGKPTYAMSSSDLRLFAQCPSRWKHGFEMARSVSLEYGALLDTLVLTPDQLPKRYAIQPEKYETTGMKCPTCGSVTDSKKCSNCKQDRVQVAITKDWSGNSTACQEWKASQIEAGREIATQADLDEAGAAKLRLIQDEQINLLLSNSDRQIWIEAEWQDYATGLIVPVRCLIDFASRAGTPCEKIIGDLKSTKNAAVGPWSKWARTAGYDLQGSWNTDLFNAATGRGITNFCFILSESFAPYEVGRRYMESDELDKQQDCLAPGREKYKAAMALYCKCLKTGKWPGYDDTDEASLTGWTRLAPDPYDEQRRMFAPNFVAEVEEEANPIETEPDGDVMP